MSTLSIPSTEFRRRPAGPVRAFAARALPWLRGFEQPIAKVLGLALLLAAVSAAAPLAVMRLVDTLGQVAAGQLPGARPLRADAGRTVLFALALVAAA